MTYSEFVEKYCDGKTPTMMQKWAIHAYLDYPAGQQLWMAGRGGGKTTCLEWLQRAHEDKVAKRPLHLNQNAQSGRW